jgi:GTPase SAR1 family protein
MDRTESARTFVDHILVIHGQRRVGKTSVLKQLSTRLPDRYIPVFFDLQGRTRTTLHRFLWWLAREVTRTLKQDRNIRLSMPAKEGFSLEAEYLEAVFLPQVQATLGVHNLLLTFDEFDSLEKGRERPWHRRSRTSVSGLPRMTSRQPSYTCAKRTS